MRNLGIDHPLVAVRDLRAARAAYAALGFRMTVIGLHPWGTSTSLAVFRDSLIELVSIGDASLLDTYPAGDFRFGRVVERHLAEREGISLIALNSEDAEHDALRLAAHGVAFQGHVRFGRDVTLPDGRQDRTSATLAIFDSPALPRLSAFAVQQHRRDLLEVPYWMEHPNGCDGYAGVTILAERDRWPQVKARLGDLFGSDALIEAAEGPGARTARGDFRMIDRERAAEEFGTLPGSILADPQPACIALHLRAPLSRVIPFLDASGARYRSAPGSLVLTEPERFGNVVLTFQEASGIDSREG